MTEKLNIVQSTTEPDKRNIWLKDNELKKFGAKGWSTIGGSNAGADHEESIAQINTKLSEHTASISENKIAIEKNTSDIKNVSDTVDAQAARLDDVDTTLENALFKNKGYFTSVEKLNEAVPNPTIGSKAYVGTSEPYAIYIVENGVWVDSGYTGGDEVIANITTDRIENGAVTIEKIATSAFDSTLSVSGKIAPADVVGEKLSELDGQTTLIKTIVDSSTQGSVNSVFDYKNGVQTDFITIEGNGLAEFIVNGEADVFKTFKITEDAELEQGTYYLSVVQNNSAPTDSVIIEVYKADGTYMNCSSRGSFTKLSVAEKGTCWLRLRTAANYNYNNYSVKVQFEKDTQTEWVAPKIIVDEIGREKLNALSQIVSNNSKSIEEIIGWTTDGLPNISFITEWENGRATDTGTFPDSSNYIRTKKFVKFPYPVTLNAINKGTTAVRLRVYADTTGESIKGKYFSIASGESASLNIDAGEYIRFEVGGAGTILPSDIDSVATITYDIKSFPKSIEEKFNLYVDKDINGLVTRSWMPYKFKPQAHRGVWGSKWHIAQNTIEAFEKAGTIDYIYGIETDVQLTKDNTWVLYHNLDLADLTTGSGTVADHTLAEIQTYRYKSHDTNGKIPTLAEYLKICRKYGKVPYMELKNLTNNTMSLDDAVSSLLNELTKYGFDNRCVLTSFTLDYILAIRKQTNKHICEYMLLSSNHDAPSITAKKIEGLPNMAIRIDESNVTEDEVEAYHSLGLLLDAQGLDDGDTARYNNLLDCGAEGCTCSDWTSIIP